MKLPSKTIVMPSSEIELPSNAIVLPSASILLPSSTIQLPPKTIILPSKRVIAFFTSEEKKYKTEAVFFKKKDLFYTIFSFLALIFI